MEFVLDARRHNADHPFVEVGVKHADGGGGCVFVHKHRLGDQHGLLAHATFDLAAFAVDGVQGFGQFVGAAGVIGQQAFDAQGHVGQTTGGIDAGAECKAEVKGGCHLGLAACCYKKTSYSRRLCVRTEAF